MTPETMLELYVGWGLGGVVVAAALVWLERRY